MTTSPPPPTMPEPPPSPSWWTLRLWHIQWVRDLTLIAGVLLIFYTGYVLRTVTIPLLLGLLLAYLLEPIVRRLVSTKILSRQGAVLGLIVGAIVMIVAPLLVGLGFAVVQGAGYAADLARNTSQLVSSVHGATETQRNDSYLRLPSDSWRKVSNYLREIKRDAADDVIPGSPFESLTKGPIDASLLGGGKGSNGSSPLHAEIPALPSSLLPVRAAIEIAHEQVGKDIYAEEIARRRARAKPLASAIDLALGWVQQNAGAIASSVGERAIGTSAQAFSIAAATLSRVGFVLFSGFLTAFFFYYFSTGYGSVVEFGRSMVPPRHRDRTFDLVGQMDNVIAGFIRGRLTICAILGTYMTVAYWAIGVPTPLILGPIVGVLFLVPFVHGLGAPVAMLLMWLQPAGLPFDGAWWWIVFAPLGVYLIAQLLDDYVLTPTIQGKATNLDSPTILFASIAGGVLAGVYGLLVAIPVAACLKILIREVYWPRVKAWSRGHATDPLPISPSN